MRRACVTALLWILAGALVGNVVAAAAALSRWPRATDTWYSSGWQSSSSGLHAINESDRRWERWSTDGRSTAQPSPPPFAWLDPPPKPTILYRGVNYHVTSAGWPVRALCMASANDVSPMRDPWGPVEHYYSVRYPAPWPTEWADARVPLRPIIPGQAINAATYGGSLWALLFLARSARPTLRRHRGLCPKCAYDLERNLAAGCPECGWNRPAADPA